MEESLDLTDALTGEAEMPSYRPDAKERRYDRQLRLWASSGQQSLEQGSILLLGADAAGSQALKNLILPGVSSFTICSERSATSKDVATNFFLQSTSVGQPIAVELVRHLGELNPAVKGHARVESPDELLRSDPDFLLSFSLIMVSNAPPNLERQMADFLWEACAAPGGRDVPLVLIRNSGFIGRLEIQFREHYVNDTHPDTTHTLRIDQPFPSLAEYAQSLNLDSLDSMEHSHVPWAVLLVKALLVWRDEHAGSAPRDQVDNSGVNEQVAFKQMINSWRRKADEENFDEAVAQAYQVWAKTCVSSELQALMDDVAERRLTTESKNIHILLAALRLYLSENPLPPISSTLPDMHSSTESYIHLQNLYKSQYRHDLSVFRKHLLVALEDAGLAADAINEDEIQSFVRNTNGIAVLRGASLSSRREIHGGLKALCGDGFGLNDWPTTLGLSLHVALLVADRFYSSRSCWPGSTASSLEQDLKEMRTILNEMLEGSGLDSNEVPEEVDRCLHEVARGGFSTLPTTAALLGGLAAQEAIKLMTSQYAPLDNTCVVDLVHSTTTRLRV